MFDLVQVFALDGKQALLEFDLLATVSNWQEIGAGLIHPDPSGPWIFTLDHGPDIADLLIDTSNKTLPTLNGDRNSLGFGSRHELQFHRHILLDELI